MKRPLVLLIFITLVANCLAQDFHVAAEANRFLNEKGNTILDINYQVAYKDLKFVKTMEGFTATLETTLAIFQDSTQVYNEALTDKIIVTDQAKTKTNIQFTRKLPLDLPPANFHFALIFKDSGSQLESQWEYDFEPLAAGSLCSDLELSSDVLTNENQDHTDFLREGKYYQVSTDHVFSLVETEKIYFYYELYNFAFDAAGLCDLNEVLILKKNQEKILEQTSRITQSNTVIPRTLFLPINELETGYYEVEVKITDQIANKSATKKDYLSIKKPRLFSERMFIDLDDEYKLVSYFLEGTQIKTWRTLTDDGKINYLNRFWTQTDINPDDDKNDFFEMIKERVEYCNKNFSHFDKGWSTDRGRIYLRNGPPDEIQELDTGLYTKYSQKEYLIWKYRTQANLTYIFIDLQTSGNFRLIYADNDSAESSAPNWQDYLGEDFDTNLLE
jgi:GWxTD domain-containing protein